MVRPSPTRRETVRRKQAEKAGRWAETLCVWWLRFRGYRILATRYRSPAGEIDIIARRANVLVAIEVKTRPDHDTALQSLRPQQQQRIARALEAYAGRTGHAGDLRLDLMIVGKWGRIAHLQNAWQRA